jgi:hypothetical protein
MINVRTFCVAVRDITAGRSHRWASLGDVIARLGMDRSEADELTARLRRQGMLELADGDRLRLTDKGRRATGGSLLRRLGIRPLAAKGDPAISTAHMPMQHQHVQQQQQETKTQPSKPKGPYG